jgi:hypothetical protein
MGLGFRVQSVTLLLSWSGFRVKGLGLRVQSVTLLLSWSKVDITASGQILEVDFVHPTQRLIGSLPPQRTDLRKFSGQIVDFQVKFTWRNPKP